VSGEAMLGIAACGGYVPRVRLARRAIVEANAWFNPGLRSHAAGQRAICNWDEDALTMAVEAARDCLSCRRRSRSWNATTPAWCAPRWRCPST